MQNTSTHEFTVPKQTPLSALYTQQYALPCGFLRHLTVEIPEGHKGLAFLEITTPGRQIVPAIGSSVRFVRGDGSRLEYDPAFPLDGPPFYITCRGYNLDMLLSHAFILHVVTSTERS